LQNFDTTRLPETLTFLGQMLFNPPNVGGWPGGSFWINASTMLGRFNFAASLTGDAGRQATPLDLGALVAATGAETMEELVDGVAALLGVALTPSTRNSLLQYMGRGSIDRPDLEIKARGLIHLTLVSPEYQAS
jgi:hypothetical protein